MDRSAGNPGGTDPAKIPLDVWDVGVILETPRHVVPAEVWNARMGGAAEHICVPDSVAARFAGFGPAVLRQLAALGIGAVAHYPDTAIVDGGRRAALGGVLPGISDY